MKHVLRIAAAFDRAVERVPSFVVAALLGVALSACSTGFADKFVVANANFQRSVAAANASIAAASPTVAKNCTTLSKIADLAAVAFKSNERYGPAFAAASGAIGGYCLAVPTDIPTAVDATAAAIAGAQASYDKAKKAGG